MTPGSDLDLDFIPLPPKKQKYKTHNRGLPSMMINTHVKFESNQGYQNLSYHLDKKFNVFFSIFSNSDLDLDFIPPKTIGVFLQ